MSQNYRPDHLFLSKPAILAGRLRSFTSCLITICAIAFASLSTSANATLSGTSARLSSPRPFPVAPHNNVTIEWWYLNSHVVAANGHHLSMICSFFRFGNGAGQLAEDSKVAVPRSHYLIWAITDSDAKTHETHSLGDSNTLSMMKEYMTFRVLTNPNDKSAADMLVSLNKDSFPPPTEKLDGAAQVTGSPLKVSYGTRDTVTAVPGEPNTFDLRLGDSRGNRVALRFEATKPAMYVGGDGNTGLRRPEDMKYVSLTRCGVVGTIDGTPINNGEGWFDHQWGDTWTTQSAGWDWWGVQLDNGTDILFFRQRELATGKVFFPLATFEDKAGNVTVTKNIRFDYDPAGLWKSAATGVTYPLTWTITFPDQATTLEITPDVLDQEMPVIAGGGAIWEGSCAVNATVGKVAVSGSSYMELVGYNSPAVRAITTKAGQSPAQTP